MKRKGWKISILMLIISLCTLGVFAFKNETVNVYAAGETYDCHYLIGEGGNPYSANQVVGSVDGAGKFVIGQDNKEINAVANDNYQFVGWNFIYDDQEGKTEFITADRLDDNSQFTLVAKDGVTEILATVEFVYVDGYIKSSKFTLADVFENIAVQPVFDHIYYLVDVNEVTYISALTNSKEIGDGDVLYYKSSTESEGITTYSNSYIEINESYYYYGTVLSDGTSYYTIHQTQEDSPIDEKIDYSRGAFRFGDTVSASFDVALEATVEESVNIDLRNIAVVADAKTSLNEYEEGVTENYFKVVKDAYLRTTSYEFNFEIIANADYVNTIDLTYHNLYVANVNILLDGQVDHNEQDDIMGTKDDTVANQLLSNISFYNFYSIVDEDELKFLAKSSSDNGSKTFGLTCVQNVAATIDGITYVYYNFTSLNGGVNKSQYFSNLSRNFEISIEYASAQFGVEFETAEFVANSGGYVLKEMNGNALATISDKRGEVVTLTSASVEDVENVGYEFKGFATSLDAEVTSSISYEINETKPQSTKIYLCYEKIEYSIVLANFNQISISGNYPIRFVTFGFTTNAMQELETLEQTGLAGQTTATLDQKIKLGSTLSIVDKEENNGFHIVGFSFKDPTQELTEGDYLTSVEITEELITSFGFEDAITIYVYEEFVSYTITYYTEKYEDNKLEENVIMANINVETDAVVSVVKYELNDAGEYVEICEANNNLTAVVAKIVVTGLKYNDSLTLISSGLEVFDYIEYAYVDNTTWLQDWSSLYIKNGEDYELNTSSEYIDTQTYYSYGEVYEYSFNWFTEDDKSTLSVIDGTTNHEEIISRDREIKVVYSMPNTRVMLLIDEEFASNSELEYTLSIKQNGVAKDAESGTSNLFVVDVGVDLEVAISDITFGYDFVGYQKQSEASVQRANEVFTLTPTSSGLNTIILKFERINYNFYFVQYGKDLDGVNVVFGALDYTVLNVDNSVVSFEKPHEIRTVGEDEVKLPFGYYVATVKFGEYDGLSSALSENNNYRENADILTYTFKLTREQFVEIVTNYSVVNAQGKNEVYVDINYLIFTYTISVEFGLTNPKGDTRDDSVVYPDISLNYVYGGENYSIIKPYESMVAVFNDVPYGASETNIIVIGGAPLGLTFAGWRYLNGDNVLNQDYAHSSSSLTIGEVVYDKYFVYKLTYNAYDVQILYNGSHGGPIAHLNNNEVLLDAIQITLYDKLVIETNAFRYAGYKFKQVLYLVPNYVVYTYDEALWNESWASLYVKEGENYILNSANNYDSEKTYYIREEVNSSYNTSDVFEISSFDVKNYAINGTKVIFNIEYELLKISMEHTFKETGKTAIWKLTGRGNEATNSKIVFNLEDFASIEILATNSSGEVRTVAVDGYITADEDITIIVSINKEAVNSFNGKAYDLSLGLKLQAVQIEGVNYVVNDLGDGKFSVQFEVQPLIESLATETIGILYNLRIQQKTVNVTTVVRDSSNFYDNISMFINAKDYGFELSTVWSSKTSSLEHGLQFLAKTSVYASFTSNEYQRYFKISGVKIYCDGVEITQKEYADYEIEITEDFDVIARLKYDLDVVFKVQPIITYNGGPSFSKIFACDEYGNGVAQTLSVGSTADSDIELVSDLVDYLEIKYVSTAANSSQTNSVINCGEYIVLITFNIDRGEEYGWLADITIAESVTLTINQKEISLIYNADKITQVEKVYDGTSDWNAERIYSYLCFTDGSGLIIDYDDIRLLPSHNLNLQNMKAYITKSGKDDTVSQVHVNNKHYYNLYVYNFSLKNATNNFKLKNEDLIISEYVKITKRTITLTGVSVYNKVYDGTDKAELVSTQNIEIQNIIEKDKSDVVISAENLVVKFTDASVGTNKSVLIDTSTALTGAAVGNYQISNVKVNGLTIYPHSLSALVPGYGYVSLLNNRGLTEKDKVGLIPLNATLSVEPIYYESVDYMEMYNHISKFVKGNNEYAIGYRLKMIIGGENVDIDKNLHLSIPYVKNLTGTYFLTGEQVGAVNYDVNEEYIIVDLNQINVNIDSFFLTQRRVLLKVWQIILIVVVITLVVTAVVLAIVIVRKKKHKEYSVHDKI